MKNKAPTIAICLLATVIFLIGFLIGLTAPKSTKNTEQLTSSDEMLVVIEDHTLAGYYIVYDKDTKIIYYQGGSNGKCLDPLYNPDGTFKLYNGGN